MSPASAHAAGRIGPPVARRHGGDRRPRGGRVRPRRAAAAAQGVPARPRRFGAPRAEAGEVHRRRECPRAARQPHRGRRARRVRRQGPDAGAHRRRQGRPGAARRLGDLDGRPHRPPLDTEDVDVQKPRLVLRRPVPEADQAPQLPTRVEASRLSLDRRSAWPASPTTWWCAEATWSSAAAHGAHYDSSGQLTTSTCAAESSCARASAARWRRTPITTRAARAAATGEPRVFDRGRRAGRRADRAGAGYARVRVERAHGRLRPEAHQDEARPAPGVKP